MNSINKERVIVPLNIPKAMRDTYVKSYMEITKNTGRLMLFAGDQKVEHINDNLFRKDVPEGDGNSKKNFRIEAQSKTWVLATHLAQACCGMNCRNAAYKEINSKTDLETSRLTHLASPKRC